MIVNLNEASDYELPKDCQSVWVGVDGFSIYICRTDEGVVVDIFQKDRETDSAIAGTYAFTHELEVAEAP